jgi:arginyl-tRNA synthetase
LVLALYHQDIAAAVYRKEHYDFHKNLYIVASQQNLHFQQWIKIIELLGFDWARDCVHIPFGLVSLEDGTMSTRHGRVVFLEEVLTRAVDQTRRLSLERTSIRTMSKSPHGSRNRAVIFQPLSINRIKTM